MKKDNREVWVGMFVILGLLLLTVFVFFVSGVYFFRPGYGLTVIYNYVSILDRGAPVRMAGVRIGEVSRVDLVFDEKAGQARVHVKLFIEKGVDIRENYIFSIRGTHILSEPHIEISPQPGGSPMIRAGAVIRGADPTAVENLIERANHIAENIDRIFGTFQEAVNDPESQEAVRNILLNWAKLSQSLNTILSGQEDDFQQAIQNMNTSSKALSEVLDRIGRGEGNIGKLVMRDELYEDMRAFVADIRAHPWKLLKKDGKDKKFLWLF